MHVPYECPPGEHYYEVCEIDFESAIKTAYQTCVNCGDFIARYLNPAPLPSQITDAFKGGEND